MHSVSPRLVISASRRTDLPGFHPEWTVRRIAALRRPLHSVFFWTKHPQAFLTNRSLRVLVVEKIENPFLLLTVTGLGGSRIEPRVPAWDEVKRGLPHLLDLFRGQPQRIRWRFDPVLPGVGAPKLFAKIAPFMRDLGLEDCIMSLPAGMSLKGDLAGQYKRAGIGRWDDDEVRKVFSEIVSEADRLSLRLFSCATPKMTAIFPGVIRPARCIDAELASSLHPSKVRLEHEKDPSQRKQCTCSVSEEIGSYTETLCRSGCLYCYSKAGGPQDW